jgi:hypothetical protein
MKKAYTSPTLTAGGNIVGETLSGSSAGPENMLTKPAGAGGIGFYL